MGHLTPKRTFEPETLEKRYFLQKQNMLSHRGEYSEQVFIRKTFSKKYPENERLCKNSCKMFSNPKDIVISSHLGIVSTN
jgi:hypothetical protein